MTKSRPITLLHVSDLHYKSSRSYDQDIVLNALLRDVEAQSKSKGQPNAIIFSGDLVHSADDERVYEKLYDSFIEPLLQVTNCDLTRVFLCPGNHDLHRNFVEKNLELQAAMEARSTSRDELNQVYLSGEAAEFARAKSREFFNFSDFFEPRRVVYSDEIVSAYLVDDLGFAIVNLNTAWLGRAGLQKSSDMQKLGIPEAAIARAINEIEKNVFTIISYHHPLSWHLEHASQDFQDLIQGKANLILCGHVHDPRPMVAFGPDGNVVNNQSGALYSWRQDRYLGYSIIRAEVSTGHTELTWRSYFDRRRAFDVATNIDDHGGCYYSSREARSYFSRLIDGSRVEQITNWVARDVLPPIIDEANEGILDRPTSEIFVSPPLSRLVSTATHEIEIEGTTFEEDVSVEDLISDEKNYLIEAYPEHGKTTLLREITQRIAAASTCSNKVRNAIPIYLPFSAFVPGTNRIEKAIRDRLPGTPPGCDLSILLDEGCFSICIDDVVFSDLRRIAELRDFISKYKENRFLLAATTYRQSERVTPSQNFGVHFEHIRLHQLRRTELRKLAKKIGDNGGSEEELLDRVVRELKAINVPATPLNSSLLMDIITRDSSYSPINRPTLIERFIETLLRKRSLGEVERKKFDFRNQVHYLGHVAEYMCRQNRYVVSYDDLFKMTVAYLDNLGLNFGARDIIDNAIASRIFVEKKYEDLVSFRFRAFLEFFVASRMREDAAFKEWVLSDDRYLSYLNEIEYFAGLQRSDLELLQLVSTRHLSHHISIFGEQFDRVLADKHFKSLPTSLEDSKKFADELAEQLKQAPLTADERDEILDADLPRDAEGRQEVFRPSPKDVQAKYIISLFMYTNLVKNTELIEDSEKRYHLSCVLKSWSCVILASFLAIPNLVKHRRMTVNGLAYVVSFPMEFSDEEVARRIAMSLPKEIARLVHLLMATEKLENQLVQKTLAEIDEPNVTEFLRSSLHIDLRLPNWWKEPGRFIAAREGDSYFQEVMLSKAADVYRLGGFSKAIELELEDGIVDNYARLYSPSKGEIQNIRNKKKAAMRRGKIVRAMRARLPGYED